MKHENKNTPNKPNIVVITSPLGNPGIGILTNLIEILKVLCNNVFVITDNFPMDEIRYGNVYIRNIENNENNGLSPSVKFVIFFSRQVKVSLNLIKISRNIDTVIFFIGGMALPVPMLLAKILRKKIIVITTGSLSKETEIRYGRQSIFYYISMMIERVNYTLSNRIVIYSKNIIPQLELNRYGNKIVLGARFVDTNIFKHQRRMDERGNIIGYIGTLSSVKGIMNLVEAFRTISKGNDTAELLICGGGPLLNEIRKKLKHDGLQHKITLAGWIPHDNLSDYLNEMKLLVLPSYSEGLPNVILEAMACGTPVLATPVGGVPDLIKDGENGFIMENNTPEYIAKNVIRALNYPDLDRIVKNARKLIEEEYSYEAAVERYRKILESV